MMAILLFNASAGENATHWLGQHQRWAWWILLAIFVHLLMKAVYEKFSAIVNKCRDTERDRDSIQTRCDELRKQIDARCPRLLGKIEGFIFGTAGNGHAFILTTLTIGNSGEPSIAQNWVMRVQIGGLQVVGQLEWIPETMSMFGEDGPSLIHVPGRQQPQPFRVIKSSDAIYNVAKKAIQRGEQVSGHLMASFNVLTKEQLSQNGNVVSVEFQDILNSQYSCSDTITGPPMPPHQSLRVAGLDS